MELLFRHDLPSFVKEIGLPLIGAEIGVAEGRFSEELLQQGVEKLYLVDIWSQQMVKGDGANDNKWHNDNYNLMLEKTKPFKDKVIILTGFSYRMANKVPDNSLSFVYLDAGHDYEAVMQDLIAWMPKLVEGGIMVGHDYLAPEYGVKKAVQHFCEGRYEVNLIPELIEENAGFWFMKPKTV